MISANFPLFEKGVDDLSHFVTRRSLFNGAESVKLAAKWKR
jgi:hypothetical protein